MTEVADTPAAARRRRWISLGEIVAVLALVISAASFWDARQQREREATAAEPAAPTARAVPLVLTGTVADGGARVVLDAAGNEVLQTQTVLFPTAVRDGSEETTGNAHIDAGWFAGGLRDALRGETARGRLPVGIVTTYLVDGVEKTDRAIYEIAYTIEPRLLRADMVRIEGITLVARGEGEALQLRLDARWQRAHPDKS